MLLYHKILRRFLALGTFVMMTFLPLWCALAQQGSSNTDPGDDPLKLTNPLKAKNIIQFLVQILDILLTFAIPIVVLFIIYGGFKLVVAQGNPSEIEKGRSAILWAIIGGVIVLSAKLIINIIQSTVTALQSA